MFIIRANLIMPLFWDPRMYIKDFGIVNVLNDLGIRTYDLGTYTTLL